MRNRWHYSQDGAQYGPVDEAEIVRLIQDGELAPGTPVLKVGSMDWQPARNHACFQVEIYPKKKRPSVQAAASTTSTPASGSGDAKVVNEEERARLFELYSEEPTEKLLKLWIENDTEEWSEHTIKVIGSVLGKRGVSLPAQISETREVELHTSVGGWLLFFCITLTICRPLFLFGTAVQDPLSEAAVAMETRVEYQRINGEELGWEESHEVAREVIAEIKANSELRPLFILIKSESFANAALAIFCFVCGCGLWARRQWALKWTKIHLCALIIWVLADWAIAAYLDTIPAIREFTGTPISTSSEAITGLCQSLVYVAIWYSYLLTSKRVRNTQWV